MDRKGTVEDFNLDRDLSVTLKSSSPHQTSRWNDPYRMVEFYTKFKRSRLQLAIRVLHRPIDNGKIR